MKTKWANVNQIFLEKKEKKKKEKVRFREYYRMLLATMEKKETATYATLV